MEKFFENNIYILFAIIVYYLLLNEKPKKDNQKIVVIYIFVSMLSVFNILDLKYMLLILLVCLFLYFEFLMEDDFKYRIIRNPLFKLIDFLYLVIIKYNFLLYTISLLFISNYFNKIINIPVQISFFIFLFLLFKVISNIINNDFELYSFSEIYNKINAIGFGKLKKLSDKKVQIVTFIEDKSFFERKNDYTFLCWDFLKYRLNRINEVILRIQEGKKNKHKIIHIFNFIIYVFKQLIYQLKDIKNYKKYMRGYSTIDMQLFRTISIKHGYQKVYQRKIIEFIYSQLFFKGLKKFYKSNYKSVTSKYFKNFILINYIKFAPIIIDNRYISIEDLWKTEIEEINDSEFFLGILCLSGKLKIETLNLGYISKKYDMYISEFSIEKDELNRAIRKMKKNLSKV